MTKIRTTAVGSWPPPFGLRPALRPFWRGNVDEDNPDIEVALTAAARIAMDEMLACGLTRSPAARSLHRISCIPYRRG